MNIADLKDQQVMIAVSGGLDSCTITHWLAAQGVDVVAYTADLGQPDEKNIEDVRDRMLASGASEMILEDLKVRADDAVKLEVHIDTDEGNACNLAAASGFELMKKQPCACQNH